MTLHEQTPNGDREAKLAIIEKIDRDSPQFSDWLALRQQFSDQENWNVGPEGDEYDFDSTSIHLVARNPRNNELIAGMRLTPITSVEHCMSWGMLSDTMREEAQQNGARQLETGNMWDLTRLVSMKSDDTDSEVVGEAVYALLGAGLVETGRPDEDPRWFFTTTQQFLVTSARMGITFHPLAAGVIDNPITRDSEPPTAFCYADPRYETEHLKRSTNRLELFTRNAVLRGIGDVATADVTSEAA